MTNYPIDFAPHWSEFPLMTTLKILGMAIDMMDFAPWRWARFHTICFDLPSAWWAACHAYEMMQEMKYES